MNTIVYNNDDEFSIHHKSKVRYKNKTFNSVYDLIQDQDFLSSTNSPIFDAMILFYNQNVHLRMKLKESKNFNITGPHANQLYNVRDAILHMDGETENITLEKYIYMYKGDYIQLPTIEYVKFVMINDFYFDNVKDRGSYYEGEDWKTLDINKMYVHFIKDNIKYYYRNGSLIATSKKKLTKIF